MFNFEHQSNPYISNIYFTPDLTPKITPKVTPKSYVKILDLLPIIDQPSEHVHQRTLMKALKNPIKWGFREST